MSNAARRIPPPPTEQDMALAQEASRTLAKITEPQRELRLVTDDNRHEMLSLSPLVLRLLQDALVHLSQGRAVTLVPHGAELTTQEAADYLNVSRPYVVQLIESGKLMARKVGTRRRIAFQDLVQFDDADRATRRAAIDEVARLSQELDGEGVFELPESIRGE
jgi:excisionase family DNA binding protein